MLADNSSKVELHPEYRHRQSRNRVLSPQQFRVKSILHIKFWLPHFFLLLTMGLVVSLLLIWILGEIPLIEPFLGKIFELWYRTAIAVMCMMTITAIHESIS
jgi:hypothetical protein